MRSVLQAIYQHFSRPKSRGWAVARQILGWCSLALYPLACLLLLEYCNYKALMPMLPRVIERLEFQWTEHHAQAVFALLVIYGVFLLLLLLLRRAWAAAAGLGALSLICAFVNYLKIMLNGLPFLPGDIALARNPGEMISFISVPMPRLFWIGALLLVLWTVVLALWRLKLPGKWYTTVPAAAAALLAVLVLFGNSGRAEKILNRFDMTLFDNALQTSNYTANGFVSGFSLNIIGMHIMAPEGYDAAAVQSILADYRPEARTGEDFDVILILAESFFDLRKLPGITLSENPLPNYDALLADGNCLSGSIVTTAHGGGTVNSEFRILTGLDLDGLLPPGGVPYNYVKADVPGYVSAYHQAGYRTVGLHLYNPNFYSRRQAYPFLGFDEFHGERDVEDAGIPLAYTRGYATDATTEAAIEHYMDLAEADGVPIFLFTITIQNHQPYGENPDNTIEADTGVLNEKSALALTTYAQGVKDADAMLGALRDYVDRRDRPTVLVWFGDHLPTLGESYRPYLELGYYDNSGSVESRKTMYSTPFLIYSNRELSQGILPARSGNEISEIYLMECVAASTGFAQSSYMRYLADCLPALPVYNEKLNMESTLTGEQREIVDAWRLLAYDRMLGKRYSEKEP